MLSDPEAGWGYEKDRYGNQCMFYGDRAHIIAHTKNEQTAVERVHSRLKGFAKLDNLKVEGLTKIRLNGLLAMLVIQAKAVSSISH